MDPLVPLRSGSPPQLERIARQAVPRATKVVYHAWEKGFKNGGITVGQSFRRVARLSKAGNAYFKRYSHILKRISPVPPNFGPTPTHRLAHLVEQNLNAMPGKFLKQARLAMGYTRAEIASFLNIDPSTYGKLENSKTKLDTDRLLLLADKYQSSLDALVGRNGASTKGTSAHPIPDAAPAPANDGFLKEMLLKKTRQVDEAHRLLRRAMALLERTYSRGAGGKG